MKIITLNIKGMTCDSCSNSVENLIDELDGIKFRDVSHIQNLGKIEFNENFVSEEKIIAKINESHYKVDMPEKQIDKNKSVIPECPVCSQKGASVPNTIFKSNLIPASFPKINFEIENYICKNPDCNVAYYSAENKNTIHKDELKRELWYKSGTKKVLGCYCNNIDKEQIRNAYEKHALTTWDEIVPHYRKKVIEKCDLLNPTGYCCRENFDKITDEIKVPSDKNHHAKMSFAFNNEKIQSESCCSTGNNRQKENNVVIKEESCKIDDKGSNSYSSKNNIEQKNYKEHWDKVYDKSPDEKLGWYESSHEQTLRLIAKTKLSKNADILIAGAGSTTLIDELLKNSYKNLTATDISKLALKRVKERLQESKISYIVDDLTNPVALKNLEPVDLWIDRAVLHFFTQKKDIDTYFNLLKDKVKKGGFVILAEFSLNGVEKCAGLFVNRYSENMLAENLGNNFELIESFEHIYISPFNSERPYIYTLFRMK